MRTCLQFGFVLGVLTSCWQGRAALAFQQPTKHRLVKKNTKTISSSSSSIVYQSNSTCAGAAVTPVQASAVDCKNNKDKHDSQYSYSQHHASRREVDRRNLHPIFKILPETEVVHSLAFPLTIAAILAVPLLLPLLPLLVVQRKKRWEQLVEASRVQHKAAFEATTHAYRQSQRILVDQLLQAQQQQLPTNESELPRVIAVTMATGQEGQGVVRALSALNNVTILALVRNPSSPAALALQQLNPAQIELVKCDSTDATSLRSALSRAEAVFLATTLNRASAGHWNMPWDGGQYQVQQGLAFAEACSQLPSLKHIVYGTAPLRKWPEAFEVEPPIHYAAKWRVEDILRAANLPVTFLRKCPYHENFTKLTKAKKRVMMGVEAGGAFDTSRKIELTPGQYEIKAFTPPEFTYNMMDPRDTGKWAVLAFRHPSLLIGESLSVASDALTGPAMAKAATDCGALGKGVTFEYAQQPRWLFETLAFVEPTFVYISGLQRWASDGGVYDLDAEGVEHVRKLVPGSTWSDHLEREGLGQFTETMADLLPDFAKGFSV